MTKKKKMKIAVYGHAECLSGGFHFDCQLIDKEPQVGGRKRWKVREDLCVKLLLFSMMK